MASVSSRPERKLDAIVTPRAAMMTARMTFYVFLSFNAGNPFTTFIVSMLTVMMLLSRFRMYFGSSCSRAQPSFDCGRRAVGGVGRCYACRLAHGNCSFATPSLPAAHVAVVAAARGVPSPQRQRHAPPTLRGPMPPALCLQVRTLFLPAQVLCAVAQTLCSMEQALFGPAQALCRHEQTVFEPAQSLFLSAQVLCVPIPSRSIAAQ